MQKKVSKYALIFLFLALLYVPTLIGLVAGDRVKTANLENRRLAEWPVFSLENISLLPHSGEHQPFASQVRTVLRRQYAFPGSADPGQGRTEPCPL